MPANESTMKFRADISNTKAAMQEAGRAIRLANAEFKEAVAGMDNWNKSSDGLTAKLKQLDTTLQAQKRHAHPVFCLGRGPYGQAGAHSGRGHAPWSAQ